MPSLKGERGDFQIISLGLRPVRDIQRSRTTLNLGNWEPNCQLLYLHPFLHHTVIGNGVRSNSENIPNGAVTNLSPQFFSSICKEAKIALSCWKVREKAFFANATSTNTQRFLSPYGTVNHLCAIDN
jgi:hypothetical protein